ncbi:MAG TPA: hypothetical protein VFE82_14125 [Ramlibacter sp.]|uniref:hypothetical protein n=1 Tax=Ramlibacter sp. TaxID=1917967 RepID=UPI002D335DF4|nr:hypothetical protein [Ramlibacter sp.]HZY19609.1 hypothetical protein [Ramlibacter sp.]
MSGQNHKGDFVMVPAHQIGYLRVICGAASRAAARAQESAAAARLEMVDAIGTGIHPSQLQHAWRLQREAIQKMNVVLFFGQLYVSTFRRHPPRGPSLAWDDGAS